MIHLRRTRRGCYRVESDGVTIGVVERNRRGRWTAWWPAYEDGFVVENLHLRRHAVHELEHAASKRQA